jgi:FkbM family methyltransferase
VEPEPGNYDRLVKNIRLNDLEKRVKAVQLACADENKQMELFIGDQPGGHSIVRNNRTKSILVGAVTLPELFRRNKIQECDLLKVDIEGGEYQLLYGLNDGFLKRIKKIHMEYHNMDGEKNNGAALKKFLELKGFEVNEKKEMTGPRGYLFCTR